MNHKNRVVASAVKALAVCIVFGSLSSCKSHHNTMPDYGQGTGNCRLSQIDHPVYLIYGSSFISYDSNGRVAKVISTAESHGRITTFSYHDSSAIIVSVDTAGKERTRDSIVLNAAGFITYHANGYKPGFNYESLYTYDKYNQLIEGNARQFGKVVQTDYYTWQNGNIVRDSFGPGKYIDYTYYDIHYQYASQPQLTDFLLLGVPIFRSRQLPSSFSTSTVPGTVQHTYTFDKAGKITSDSLFNTSSNSGYLTTFTYECK